MNQRELEVLDIVCSTEKPMTSTDVVNCKKGLTQSTVIAVLRKLFAQKIVDVSGVTHSGKVLSRTYIPGEKAKESVEDYYKEQFKTTKHILTKQEMKKILEETYAD